MGQAKQKATATQKMIRAHPQCSLCGGIRATKTREHFPPTNFFDQFHRPEQFVVPACDNCNRGTGVADLLAGIMARIGFGEPTAQELDDNKKLMRKLRSLRPDFYAKMLSIGPVEKIKNLSRYRRLGLDIPDDCGMFAITGEMFQYLNLFAHKAVLCHYFHAAGRILGPEGGVLSFLRPKELVALGAIPPELLNILGPTNILSQGSRRFEVYEYREDFNETDGVYGVACRFRTGFQLFGLAAEDLSTLDEETRVGFVSPSNLPSILTDENYKHYNQFEKATRSTAA
ncbi:hypothetical protein A7A08_01321 [Methyloligella halotolerans]|uniref:HNH endonuclease 5 domain-containing protein n=1 Tax=Methyloligella halotolerans TaxID=1177755 RepID=A0A1E2S178_9HYPH|nr:hypothetical protein [Methyloligella halotolerans]ODA68150.1 hypothetical protein A7A08_01321 [Methyloligella halotolerans]